MAAVIQMKYSCALRRKARLHNSLGLAARLPPLIAFYFRKTIMRTAGFLLVAMCATLNGWANPDDGQSEAERALEVPAGPWLGTWRVARDDPHTVTRGDLNWPLYIQREDN